MMPSAEHRIENLVSRILRIGITVSSGLITLGFLVYLVAASRTRVPSPVYQHAPAVSPLASDIIGIGLFLLILTPVSRVAVAAFAYAHAKDKQMTVVALVVLTLLVISFVAGLLLP